MRALKNTCWLACVVAVAASGTRVAANDQPVLLARFAVIFPAADPAMEEKQLSPGAVWLRQPTVPKRKASATAAEKKNPAKQQKASMRVTPLRRERPTRETNPPTTRRRQLGW